ncbi:hypothetical protein M2161_003586 [Streptomyces sp. SAI-133]|nr:hypothetical protein [Streptomyces sp. SAI-133]
MTDERGDTLLVSTRQRERRQSGDQDRPVRGGRVGRVVEEVTPVGRGFGCQFLSRMGCRARQQLVPYQLAQGLAGIGVDMPLGQGKKHQVEVTVTGIRLCLPERLDVLGRVGQPAPDEAPDRRRRTEIHMRCVPLHRPQRAQPSGCLSDTDRHTRRDIGVDHAGIGGGLQRGSQPLLLLVRSDGVTLLAAHRGGQVRSQGVEVRSRNGEVSVDHRRRAGRLHASSVFDDDPDLLEPRPGRGRGRQHGEQQTCLAGGPAALLGGGGGPHRVHEPGQPLGLGVPGGVMREQPGLELPAGLFVVVVAVLASGVHRFELADLIRMRVALGQRQRPVPLVGDDLVCDVPRLAHRQLREPSNDGLLSQNRVDGGAQRRVRRWCSVGGYLYAGVGAVVGRGWGGE